MLPFWTSFLLRVYAWKALLTEHGLAADAIEALGLDRLLAWAGLIPGPGQLMNTPFSLVLGMTYTYLPFMILPLYSNLAKMDLRLLEAASDLGATAWTAFWTVTVPMSRAGIIAGAMLVFIPCVGEWPGDSRVARRPADADDRPHAVGRVLQQQRLADGLHGRRGDDPARDRAGRHLQPLSGRGHGAARRMNAGSFNRCFARAWLILGYAFLYVPIVALVAYSFNDSPVANLWRGFTLKWYAALATDQELLAGLALSLKVALSTACAAIVLGTLAAFAMTRYRRFFGSTLFAGMVAAPLVMPEVIIGLSLLLMLVSLQRATEAAFGVGFPERGMLTIWLGHLLLGMAYATVVVRARLQTLNPQLEEAAMDLGARPWQVFWLVTLPMIGQWPCCRPSCSPSRSRSTTSCCRPSCPARARRRCRWSFSRAPASASTRASTRWRP